MASNDYFFFADANQQASNPSAYIAAQDAPGAAVDPLHGAYGRVAPSLAAAGKDEYRVTSLHSATFNPTAYAACDAIACVQQVPSTALVNLILKPLVQPALNFAPVKYIIYKGILANSLIAANGTDVAPAANNDLTKFLWDEQAKKNASAGTTASAPAKALGIDLTGTNFADTDPIDNLFYRAGVAFQLPPVTGGWSLGRFDVKFGIEVLMEGLNFRHLLSLARQIESRVSVLKLPSGPNAALTFEHWHDKEQVLGFMDPCAFYGSFFRAGVQVKTSGNVPFARKAGNALYQDVLFPFANRSTAYLDIRNEHNFSFNYFGNYNDSLLVGNGTNLPQVDYYDSGWPILTLTAANFPTGNTTKARHGFQLRLPEGDNPKPLIYVSQGYRELRTRGKRFPAELASAERFFDAFLPFGTGYATAKAASGSKSLTFVLPNLTGQSATTPVSCYIRLKYLKQEQGATTAPTVIQAANYLDNLIWPIDLKILLEGTAPIRSAFYDEEVYVNAQDVSELECDFIAKLGIARDAHHTSFIVMPTSVRTKRRQASVLVTLSGEASDYTGHYPNFVALKYPLERVLKSDLDLSAGTIVPVADFVSDDAKAQFVVPDFDKFFVIVVNNATYDSWKARLAAVGAPLDNRFRTYLGVTNLQSATDADGIDYTSFELVLRGFALDTASAGYAVKEVNTDLAGTANITVYTHAGA